jgi:archaetidylinositol phosphate synthase
VTLADLDDKAEDAFEPVVAAFESAGATPNQVSVLSFVVAVVAAAAFYVAPTTNLLIYVAASVLVAVSGALDGVDGQLARRTGTSSAQGDMLDHTLDRYSDLALVAGIAGGVGSWAVGFFAVTGVFLTSYMGTQAQAVGAGRDYGGLLGRADRMALVILGGFVQPFVPLVEGRTALGWLLVVLGVVGNLTALQRFRASWDELS